MRVLVMMLMMMSTNQTYAQDNMFSSFRPFVEKYISANFAITLWGDPKGIDLPAIPNVKADAKSLDVYKNKKKETVTFPQEQMNQYNIAFVREIIEVTREVKANRDDLSKWMGTLMQGATREGIYRALVLDSYYARMENYNETMNKATVDFSLYFMKTYIGKDLTAEKFSGFNTYTAKRILTEKALDLMDVYLSDNESGFYDWYAHLSAELATKFPIWKNKLRANKNSYHHRAWAMKVPKQFVKSEVIIKLHKLFNNLKRRN